MKDDDYPALFTSSDSESRRGQAVYIRMMLVNLGCLSIVGVIGSLPIEDAVAKFWLSRASFVLLMMSTIFSLLIQASRKEELWFDGRVVAESVKSLTWKYMMRADPYELDDSDQQFKHRIRDIGIAYVDTDLMPRGILLERPIITEEMKNNRSLNLEGRIKLYLDKRLKDQMRWYSSKSVANGKSAAIWSNAVVVSNLIMLFIIGFNILNSSNTLTLIGILSATSASIISWTQTKKFNELKISYRIAANDLSHALESASNVMSEQQLSSFVSDAETAISREHTAWLSRKGRT